MTKISDQLAAALLKKNETRVSSYRQLEKRLRFQDRQKQAVRRNKLGD